MAEVLLYCQESTDGIFQVGYIQGTLPQQTALILKTEYWWFGC